MSSKYRFKRFDSLITSCSKHIFIQTKLRNIIIKLLSIIEDVEIRLNIKFGIVCIEKTYSLVNLIVRFCNIHLFKCNESNYTIQSLEINTYLENLYSSLDLMIITTSATKFIVLSNINEILYKFSYKIQDLVLNNNTNTRQKNISEETIVAQSDSSLIKDITNYFDNEFEDAKDDIYKFIDES